jgi:hypothetical protein
MKYEVQTYTLCGGWINLWTDDDSEPVTFDSREAAEAYLSDYLETIAHAVKIGNMVENFNPKEYKIEKVPA